MTDTRREPATHQGGRDGAVSGFVESARMWAREQGLPVSRTGPLPPAVVDRYRRRYQLRE